MAILKEENPITAKVAEAPKAPQPQVQAPLTVKEMVVKLKNPSKIDFTICNTGERNSRMLHEPKFILTKGVLFKIPLTDSSLNYATADVIKLISPNTEYFRVLDVVNGIATIEAIIHGAFVEDGQLLGYIY